MKTVKLLFDQSFIGKPLVPVMSDTLKALGCSGKLKHILDWYPKTDGGGVPDEVWVKRAAKEDWIVVSADLGKSTGLKLPALCIEYGVSHILATPTIHGMKASECARAIIAVWHQIIEMTRKES